MSWKIPIPLVRLCGPIDTAKKAIKIREKSHRMRGGRVTNLVWKLPPKKCVFLLLESSPYKVGRKAFLKSLPLKVAGYNWKKAVAKKAFFQRHFMKSLPACTSMDQYWYVFFHILSNSWKMVLQLSGNSTSISQRCTWESKMKSAA